MMLMYRSPVINLPRFVFFVVEIWQINECGRLTKMGLLYGCEVYEYCIGQNFTISLSALENNELQYNSIKHGMSVRITELN